MRLEMHQVHCEYIRHREWLLWKPTEKGLLAQLNSKMAASCKVSLICHPQEKSYVWLIFLWQVAAILSKVNKGDVGLTRLCNGVENNVNLPLQCWLSISLWREHTYLPVCPTTPDMDVLSGLSTVLKMSAGVEQGTTWSETSWRFQSLVLECCNVVQGRK